MTIPVRILVWRWCEASVQLLQTEKQATAEAQRCGRHGPVAATMRTLPLLLTLARAALALARAFCPRHQLSVCAGLAVRSRRVSAAWTRRPLAAWLAHDCCSGRRLLSPRRSDVASTHLFEAQLFAVRSSLTR